MGKVRKLKRVENPEEVVETAREKEARLEAFLSSLREGGEPIRKSKPWKKPEAVPAAPEVDANLTTDVIES
jgi:hypothetical protein